MTADPAPDARARRLRYAALGLYVACLVGASVVPASGVPSATGPLGVGVDKWLHLAGYAGLGAVAAAALRARTRRALVVAAAFAVGIGAGVEAVQGLLPYRSLSAADALANAAGAALGAAFWRVRTGREYRRGRRDEG